MQYSLISSLIDQQLIDQQLICNRMVRERQIMRCSRTWNLLAKLEVELEGAGLSQTFPVAVICVAHAIGAPNTYKLPYLRYHVASCCLESCWRGISTISQDLPSACTLVCVYRSGAIRSGASPNPCTVGRTSTRPINGGQAMVAQGSIRRASEHHRNDWTREDDKIWAPQGSHLFLFSSSLEYVCSSSLF